MDQLDINLQDAWERISAKVKADRFEALRRAGRQFTLAMQRPMRAWCLCIRASDTRITPSNAIIEPALRSIAAQPGTPARNHAFAPHDDLPTPSPNGSSFIGNLSKGRSGLGVHSDDPGDPGDPGEAGEAGDLGDAVVDDRDLVAVNSVNDFIAKGLPHRVTLGGELIRELTKPVRIPFPGIDWLDAAAKLGRHQYTLRGWMKCGTLQSRREYSRCFGYRGKPKPIVWSSEALDPNAHNGRAPDPIWGTLWQWMWEQLPADYAVTAERVPSTRHWNATNQTVQRGWSFICPGRLRQVVNDAGEVTDEHIPCGRRVARLYGPQSVWTLGQAMDLREGIDIELDSDRRGTVGANALAGPWFPGLVDPVRLTGPRSFACHYCWRVRYTSLLDRHGWNDFITHISGGLLYGHEVERSCEHARPERKRRYAKQSVPRIAPGRNAVLDLLMRGIDEQAIARVRRISRASVRRHVRTLCAMHDVRTGEQLVAKLRERSPQQTRRTA